MQRVEQVLGQLTSVQTSGQLRSESKSEFEIGKPDKFLSVAAAQVDTPALCVSRFRLLRNIESMQERANKNKVNLRPHCKTHKTLEIGQMQIAKGAKGICVAKVDEALIYARSGFDDILIAYPLLSSLKLDRLFELSTSSKASVVFSFVVDSLEGVNALERAASRWPVSEKSIPVFIKIDVGLHRVGMKESSSDLANVAQRLSHGNSCLDFIGLLSHAGHAYGAQNKEEILDICEQERLLLLRIKAKLERTGLLVREISVGSTPTELCRKNYDGITEIRPGNYVFCDMTPLRLGLVSFSDISLFILAQVVSINEDWIIIDAGSKVLSSDKGAHGMTSAAYGVACILQENGTPCDTPTPLLLGRLSEEHGWISRPPGLAVRLQSRVIICPAHSCPVVNLAPKLVVVDDTSIGHKIGEWEVVARSSSH